MKFSNNSMNNGIKTRLGTGGNPVKSRLGLGVVSQPNVLQKVDARNRLIQKKRLKISDARERLAELAKQGDARLKLNKIKSRQAPMQNNIQKAQPNVAIQNVVQQNQQVKRRGVVGQESFKVTQTSFAKGNNINVAPLHKTGLQGRTLMKAGSLMRTVSGIQKQATVRPVQPFQVNRKLNVNTERYQPLPNNPERYHPLPNNPNVVTIKNDKLRSSDFNKQSLQRTKNLPQKTLNIRQKVSNVHQKGSSVRQKLTNMNQKGRHNISPYPLTTQRSSSDDQYKRRPSFKGPIWNSESEPYQQPIKKMIGPTHLKITTSNNNYNMDYPQPMYQRESEWESHVPYPRQLDAYRPTYNNYEEDEYIAQQPKKQPVLSSNIISRLDQPQRNPQPPPHPGYKVVVTNLHHVVTLEDVEELFGNIGPIKYARVVREGIAEVVFVNEDDAYRSVEIYDNRQLDGQAMNVTVTSKKFNDSISTVARFSPSNFSAPSSIQRSLASTSASSHNNSRGGGGGGGGGGNGMQDFRGQTKSVLKAAGGSIGQSHQQQSSFTKRPQQIDIAPDVSTIHHALFSGKATNQMTNQQFYVKLPKPPVGRVGKQM